MENRYVLSDAPDEWLLAMNVEEAILTHKKLTETALNQLADGDFVDGETWEGIQFTGTYHGRGRSGEPKIRLHTDDSPRKLHVPLYSVTRLNGVEFPDLYRCLPAAIFGRDLQPARINTVSLPQQEYHIPVDKRYSTLFRGFVEIIVCRQLRSRDPNAIFAENDWLYRLDLRLNPSECRRTWLSKPAEAIPDALPVNNMEMAHRVSAAVRRLIDGSQFEKLRDLGLELGHQSDQEFDRAWPNLKHVQQRYPPRGQPRYVGFPDIVLPTTGTLSFVEVKRPNENFTKRQKWTFPRLVKRGFRITVARCSFGA